MPLKLPLLFLLACFSFGSAGAISVSGLEAAPGAARDFQLLEFGQAFKPGTSGYWGAGVHYLPFSSQTRLRSPYGLHNGYAFRHHFAYYGAQPIGDTGLDLGILWWAERHGWDNEDFLVFPNYGRFSLVRSVHTWGATIASPKGKWGFGAGVQYTHPELVSSIYRAESDSLYEWAHLVFGRASLQTSFHHADWRHVRLSLDLQSRKIWGGASSGVSTYFPDLDFTLYNGAGDSDSAKIVITQNIFRQYLYLSGTFYAPNYGFRSLVLSYYLDPSQIVALDASCTRLPNGNFVWGGGLKLPFIRIAYNHPYDMDRLFGSRGTVMLEFQISLSTANGGFFGLRAPKAAPMQDQPLIPPKGTTVEGIKDVKESK
ncbi:MAG: hypothetical protein LBR60_02345 [Fibrobacter sp.]|nr:hypothetical protein [Fibrobacter sp.]